MIKHDGTTKPKYVALQALRGLAAALVVYVHALATYTDKIDPTFISTMSGLGELGVKIFFCISGFIIFNSSRNMKPGFSSVGVFLRRRIIRVAPIYWIATAIYSLKLYIQGSPITFEAFLKSLLFIPYSNEDGLMHPVLGQGWTLNYEMFFYVIFGLALLFSKTKRVFVVSCILIFLMFLRSFDVVKDGVNSIESIFFFLSENYLMYFLFGLLIALLIEKKVIVIKRFNEIKKTLAIISLLAIYLLLRSLNVIPSEWLEVVAVIISVTCLLICVLGASSAKADLREGRLNRISEVIGDASYSTYLTHGFVMGPIARAVSLSGIYISPQTFSILMIFSCTLFGVFFFKNVEKPVLTYLNSKFL